MNKAAPIVVIGTGLAGYLFAKELRKCDQDSPLTILSANDGAFYSKPSLSTAFAHKKTPQTLVVETADTLSTQLKATIHTHSPVLRIDPEARTIHTSTRAIAYDKLVLACGSRPRLPQLNGAPPHAIKSINDLEAYADFREWLVGKKHLTILGTGLVGCEFANDLLHAGIHLDIISLDPYPLSRLVPESIGHAVTQALSGPAIRWHFNTQIASIHADQEAYIIVTDTGETIRTEGVLSAIGIQANRDLAHPVLGVNRGIKVDQHLRTTHPDIFALGDCAEVAGHLHQYIAPLLQCARILARNLRQPTTPVVYPPMPVAIKTPACPIVTVPPPEAIAGQWEYTDAHGDHRALFYDDQKHLRGFTLTGRYRAEKNSLIEQLTHSPKSAIEPIK